MEYDLVFKDLIDEEVKLKDGTIVVIKEKLLYLVESKLAGQKRKTLTKQKNPDARSTNRVILEKYVTAEDIIRNVPSVAALDKRNNDRANGDLPEKEKEVKFDDIRNMKLGIDNLEGYTEAEKQIIQKRLNELSQDFNLEKTTDKFLAWRVALCELKIMQLETLAILNPKEATKCQTQVDLLDKQYKVFCESLNVLKRQRDGIKDKPKDESGISEAVNKMSKPIEELQKEAKELKEKKEKFLKERGKKR